MKLINHIKNKLRYYRVRKALINFIMSGKPILKSTLDNRMNKYNLTKEDIEFFFNNDNDFDIDMIVILKSLDISLNTPRFKVGYRLEKMPHVTRDLETGKENVTFSPGEIKAVSLNKDKDWGIEEEYMYDIVHDDGTCDHKMYEHAIYHVNLIEQYQKTRHHWKIK